VSDRKKIRKLLLRYNRTLEELRQTRAIKTGKIVADYGEYVVAKRLGLELAKNPSQKGYDAIGKRDKKKYEIKTRHETPWNKPRVFSLGKKDLRESDYLIYIEFSWDWRVQKLLKIPSNEAKPNKNNQISVNKVRVKKYSILGKTKGKKQ